MKFQTLFLIMGIILGVADLFGGPLAEGDREVTLRVVISEMEEKLPLAPLPADLAPSPLPAKYLTEGSVFPKPEMKCQPSRRRPRRKPAVCDAESDFEVTSRIAHRSHVTVANNNMNGGGRGNYEASMASYYPEAGFLLVRWSDHVFWHLDFCIRFGNLDTERCPWTNAEWIQQRYVLAREYHPCSLEDPTEGVFQRYYDPNEIVIPYRVIQHRFHGRGRN